MKFGVCLPNFGLECSAESLREMASAAERLGYDSVWMTDHILVEKDKGWPYEKLLESITSIAYLSGTMNKLKLGVSVLVIAIRNPIIVARQLATIDILNNGRTILGIGTGYNEPEFTFLGANFHDRGMRVSESIRVIKALWKGEMSFQGKYIRFRNAAFGPLPARREPEIWVGGTSINSMRRAIALGHAWHPTVSAPPLFDNLIAQFRSLPGGKDKPIVVRIGLNSYSEEPKYPNPIRDKREEKYWMAFCMNKTKNRELVKYLQKLGVNYAVLDPVSPSFAQGGLPIRNQIDGLGMFANDFIT